MLTVPLEKRKADKIPQDLIAKNNQKIADTKICINDVSHTKTRAWIERIHLEIFSRLRFVKY